MVNDLDIVLNSELNNTKNRYNKWMTDYKLFKNSSKLVQISYSSHRSRLDIYTILYEISTKDNVS